MHIFKLLALSTIALFCINVHADDFFKRVQSYCSGKPCQTGVFFYHIEAHLPRYCNSVNYALLNKEKRGYLAHIANRVVDTGVPEEVIAIPLTETGLRPDVTSSANAKGMWQFKAETAREMGLKVTDVVDERLDWKASTEAGLRYVKKLIKVFDGDTALGVLAYNVGMGTLRKKMKEYGTRSPFILSNGIFAGKEGEQYLNRIYGYSFVYYNIDVCSDKKAVIDAL